MNKIVVEGAMVRVQLTGWSRVWALKTAIIFPRSSVARAHRLSGRPRPPMWRVGTAVPGLYYAGTFYGHGQKEFWSTRFKGAVVLELKDAEYAKIVADVEDPDQVLAALAQG